jgi:hypothetical protein
MRGKKTPLLFAFLFIALSLYAEDALPGLEFRVQTVPEIPVQGSAWTVLVLVNHPFPQQIQVRQPALPPGLSLERIRIEARTVRGIDGRDERWTAAEFLFIPLNGGTLNLGSFEIIGPGKRSNTSEITRQVRGLPNFGTGSRPVFVWESVPRSLKAGDSVEIALRIRNRDARRPLPGASLFRQEPPLNALFEEQPVSQAEREQGLMLRLRLIPLEGPEIVLKPLRFLHDGNVLEIPALKIPVTDEEASEIQPAPDSEEPESGHYPVSPLFPQADFNGFPLFKASCQRSFEDAGALWESGRYTEALAGIRLAERDSLSGPFLIPLRRNMEKALGIAFSPDETWRPGIFITLLFLSGFLCIFSVVLPFIYRYFFSKPGGKKHVTSYLSRGYKLRLCAGAVLCAVAFLLTIPVFAGRKYAVVSEAAEARKTPDLESAQNARFREGEAVNARFSFNNWVYAETADGRSGWVNRETLIFY